MSGAIPAFTNSSVGSFAGITEAASIRWWPREVKNLRNVSRISSLLVGLHIGPVNPLAAAEASHFRRGQAPPAASAPPRVQCRGVVGLVPPARRYLKCPLMNPDQDALLAANVPDHFDKKPGSVDYS